jgi:YidC/Oxa1 family membrane protein insertase
MNLLPWADAGVIVIIFTIIVKFILLPLSIKASKAQIQMKSIEKDLNDIKEKYKDNKEEQSRKTLEYYRDKGVNPFAGIFILLVQFPIIIGLYQVFLKSGLPVINLTKLYSFVAAPAAVNMVFLHIINISEKSIWLALVAGMTTFIQLHIANSAQESLSLKVNKGEAVKQSDFARAMTMQMKYFFPIIVTFISYSISGALALYWITNNIFAIGQEIYIKKKYHETAVVV